MGSEQGKCSEVFGQDGIFIIRTRQNEVAI